jgi:hypothetical protein
MKFSLTLESTKAICLAVGILATAILSNITPLLAQTTPDNPAGITGDISPDVLKPGKNRDKQKPPASPVLPRRLPLAPSIVISAPGKPQVVIFGQTFQSFPIGCGALRSLWSKLPTKEVTSQEYNKAFNFQPLLGNLRSEKGGNLFCNSPNVMKGYTSPLFGSYAGVIVTEGKPFFIDSHEFFTAMGITPTQLKDPEARDFIAANKNRFGNTLLTTRK